ncbi:MAG: hypothetical protein R3A80_02935 [Bdellovibrionota bacterium]
MVLRLFFSFILIFTLSLRSEAQNNELSFPEFLKAVSKDEPNMTSLIEKVFSQLLGRDYLTSEQLQKISYVIQTKDFEKFQRFPTLTLSDLRKIQGLKKIDAEEASIASAPIKDALENIFSSECSEKLPEAKIVVASIPDLKGGNAQDPDASDCKVDRSIKLARLLSSLIRNDGSEVTYQNNVLRTPEDLMRALLSSGHHVVMTNEKNYADFNGWSYKGKAVRTPLWIDTEVDLDTGERLVIPAGHSALVFRVTGGDLIQEAQVSFYFGTLGVNFYPDVELRPKWNESKVFYAVDSLDVRQRDEILAALDVIGRYSERHILEIKTLGPLPMQGYGYLGVCNDSVAVVELLTHSKNMDLSKISAFPLGRAKELNQKLDITDDLSEAFALLPKDLDVVPERADLLRRVLRMNPFGRDYEKFFDPDLARQIQQVEKELLVP